MSSSVEKAGAARRTIRCKEMGQKVAKSKPEGRPATRHSIARTCRRRHARLRAHIRQAALEIIQVARVCICLCCQPALCGHGCGYGWCGNGSSLLVVALS